MGKLSIIDRGLYSSIQDLGRVGYQRFGVPQSGTMDQHSAKLANLLTQNPLNAPVIEITQIGPKLFFYDPALIAITGANLTPAVDGKIVSMNKPISIQSGQTLSFGSLREGLRAYIAIHGLHSEFVLGSFSQYSGVTANSRLEKGDKLSFDSPKELDATTSTRVKREFTEEQELLVYPGPEFELLSDKQSKLLLFKGFEIKENDRMGYQLEPKEKIELKHSMITVPVIPGTVQLTPSGRLLALMRDAQVTGGYPRLFQLTERSINQLAQLRTGKAITFKLVDPPL